MDLLEGLDDVPTHRKTFKKQIDIHIEQDDEVEDLPIIQEKSIFGFNSNALNDILLPNIEPEGPFHTADAKVASSTPYISKFSTISSDIIKNVQRRLNGEILEVHDKPEDTEPANTQLLQTQVVSEVLMGETQIIKASKTQEDSHEASIANLGFGTQKVNLHKTAVDEQEEPAIDHESEKDEHFSHENNDVEDLDKLESLFLNESENDDSSLLAAKEKRALKIAERAAAKRLLREKLENEKKVTAQEIDDFEELENSRIVSSIEVKKRSKKDEKILAETRRLQREVEFVPAPTKNKVFDKLKLFADFGFEDESPRSSPVRVSPSPIKDNKSTPTTSPMATPSRTQKRDIENDASSDEDFELENVLDLLDNSKIASKKLQRDEQERSRRTLNNPLKSYEEKLNDKIINRKGMKMIELDSDPEIDTIEHLKARTSKETILDVKSKFVQKRRQKGNSALGVKGLNQFFPNLPTKSSSRGFVASVNSKATRQLRDLAIAKKLEKGETEEVTEKGEELNIQDLLEREIERNIRLRKKENRRSKDDAESVEYDSSEDGEYDSENSNDSADESELEAMPNSKIQVQSSFIDGSQGPQVSPVLQKEDDDEEQQEQILHPVKHKQRKTALLSDDDDDNEETNDGQSSIRSTQLLNNNVSYMYGAQEDLEHTHENNKEDVDDFQLGTYGSQPNLKKMLGISMTQAFESTLPQGPQGSNLMENLRKGQLPVLGEEDEEDSSFELKDSFLVGANSTVINKSVTFDNHEETLKSQTQAVENLTMPLQTQNIVIGTQADKPSTVHDITQIINQSQTVKPQTKRKLVRKLERILESDSEIDEESESDEETRRISIAIAKEKQRQKEIRRKRQMKEWKRKGVTDIVDDEATESEDEFHGLGGADGDYSDQENSEDEKMLDDTSKVDLKANELRSKFAEDEKQRNENDVRKLFEDIKTGRLRRRRGGDSLDIELSEDEEDMKNFYMSRLNKQRDRLLQNEKIASIAANDKSRAFFETIAERPVDFRLDDDGDDGVEVLELDDDDEHQGEQEDDPFVENGNLPLKKKRKLKISHDYITTTLAEVCDSNTNVEDDETQNRLFAKYQHGFTDEVEDQMDLLALKKQSSILMSTEHKTVTEISTTQAIGNDDDDDDDDEFNPIRKSSVIKSFQRFNSSGTSNGVREVEVTISKAYKSSTTSKASIGYLANRNGSGTLQQGGRTLKARNIERDLKNRDRSSGLSNVFKSGNFN